jgi:hypothetical protein
LLRFDLVVNFIDCLPEHEDKDGGMIMLSDRCRDDEMKKNHELLVGESLRTLTD